jgi:ADP-ribose pyrophosphatase
MKMKVEILSKTRAYDGFFKIDKYVLQREKFDGSNSGDVHLEIFERGHAVAVLPYDPVTDKVLLIRAFLIGSHLNGLNSYPLQVVAGGVKEGEDGIAVAIREAEEEAGCKISHAIPAQHFLPSPGGTSERVETYVALADLSNAGGVFGLEEENEDIRAEIYSADDAIAMMDAGEIQSGLAVVVLSWFARNREKVRGEFLAKTRRIVPSAMIKSDDWF